MPVSTTAELRAQIAGGKVPAVCVLVGADEPGKLALAGELVELVEPDLRAFNVDRLYGGEVKAADIVDAARTLPMMTARRVVLLLYADRLLNPKSPAKRNEDEYEREMATLDAYVRAPVDTCCLVVVAAALDKRRAMTKLLMTRATVVECSGPADIGEAARWVKERVAQEHMAIDPRAARLMAERVGPDIMRLRTSVERLLLYAAGTAAITEADVRDVVAQTVSPQDWGVTNAIERGMTAEALRELALALENGAVPYLVLGQLAWYARTKMPAPRAAPAVEAVFRTDLAIKTSAGDPRVLLERLVVELCGK